MKVVCASGYFNPLHLGHLNYLIDTKKLGDKLIVIVNNDKQVGKKGSIPFMDEKTRMAILNNLKCVDEVFLSIDKDKTVCESLKKVRPDIFAKGGDRTAKEIPESKVCKDLGIKIVDGLGPKIQHSSHLIEDAAMEFIRRHMPQLNKEL